MPLSSPPDPDRRFTIAWVAVAFGAFATGIAYLFWPTFASGLVALPGTLGDFRFISVILEHWYRVLLGRAAWLDPAFFHPQPGVLGYSDALFLFAVPYALFRLARIAPYYAFFATLVATLGMSFAGTLWLLRRILGIAWPVAIAATTIFVFSNMIVLKIIHPNMYAVAFVPVLVGLLWRVVAAIGEDRRFLRQGLLFAILSPLLLYTSYYIGWFAVFLFLLWGLVFAALLYACERRVLSDFLSRAWAVRRSLAALGVVFVLCLVPFVVTHLQPYLEHEARLWPEVVTMLPTPGDLVNVGWGNPVWTRMAATLVPANRPMAHELTLGMPPGLLIAFAIVLGIGATRMAADCRRRESALQLRERALLSLALTVVVCWLLMIQVRGVSLWSLVYALVPGSGTIRAVFRLQLLLGLAIVTVVAFALNDLWRNRRRRVLVGAVLLLLVAEQFNYFRVTYDARAESARLARLQPPPQSCRYFAVAPQGAPPGRHWFEVQVDAMVIAQRMGIPTINGYSSVLPNHWNPTLERVDAPGYADAALSWLRSRGLTGGLCLLDLRSGTWWSPRAAGGDLRNVNFMRRNVTTFEDGLAVALSGLHAREAVGRWTDGEATIVPAQPIPARRVSIEGQVLDPAGSRIRIAVNGVTRVDEVRAVGAFRYELPQDAPVARVEIASTTFVPKLTGMNADTRQLGVVLSDVTVD